MKHNTPAAAAAAAIVKEEPIEQELSQKMIQLSAEDRHEFNEQLELEPTTCKKRLSLTSNIEVPASQLFAKKFKSIEEDRKALDLISNYLSSENGRFDSTLNPILKCTYNPPSIEDLRQFASILHSLLSLQLDKLLWKKYLQAGTGELFNEEQIRSVLMPTARLSSHRYWSIDVKLRMIKRHETTIQDPKQIDDESCLDYVQRVLTKFDQQGEFYENQLTTFKRHCTNIITETMENAVTRYVQDNGIALYRIYIDKLIANVEFDYKDQLLVLEYQCDRPNAYQRETFANLFQLKRATEEAKLEIAVLKQRITSGHLPKSFETFRIPAAIKFDDIQANHIRRRFKDRCTTILQHTISEMMLVAVGVAETKFEEYQKKFDKEMVAMKQNQSQNHETFYDRFTPKQLDIVHRRFRLLDERLMSIYKFKLCFFDKAPTDMN